MKNYCSVLSCNLAALFDDVMPVEGYPLVCKKKIFDDFIYIKKLPFDEERIKLLRYLYSSLENSNYYFSIIKDSFGNNVITIDDQNYIISFELEECLEYPSPEWWAGALAELHQISITQSMRTTSKDVFDYNALWECAQIHMDQEVKVILTQMQKMLFHIECDASEYVINHGDPLCSNVRRDGNFNVFIDLENCVIAPKEYDIQRHLWDYSIDEKNTEKYCEHWRAFRHSYENKYRRINIELLKHLLVADVCRTISWLYLVTLDEKRLDYSRQLNDLLLLKEAICSRRIEAMLQVL